MEEKPVVNLPDLSAVFAADREHQELVEQVRRGWRKPVAAAVRRPWWKKKRWTAAALAAAFPFAWELSSGPAQYAASRGWPGAMAGYGALYPSLFTAEYHLDRWTGGGGLAGRGVANLAARYREWWRSLAVRHNSEERAPD